MEEAYPPVREESVVIQRGVGHFLFLHEITELNGVEDFLNLVIFLKKLLLSCVNSLASVNSDIMGP